MINRCWNISHELMIMKKKKIISYIITNNVYSTELMLYSTQLANYSLMLYLRSSNVPTIGTLIDFG